MKNISRDIGAVLYLVPKMCITKETEIHLLFCCDGNTFGFSVFLSKTKYLNLQPFEKGQKGLALNTHDSYFHWSSLILGTKNVHHKRNRNTLSVLLRWQHFWLHCLSVKNQVSQFATLRKGTESLTLNTHDSHFHVTVPIRLLRVYYPCLR